MPKKKEVSFNQALDIIGRLREDFYQKFGKYPSPTISMYMFDYFHNNYTIKIEEYNAQKTTFSKKETQTPIT